MLKRLNAIARLIVAYVLLIPLSLAGDVVEYELTFDSVWSAATHPTDFPPNAHFSGIGGTTHNHDYSVWEPGGMSSPGVQSVAESGARGRLATEVMAAIDSGTARGFLNFAGINSPGSRTGAFTAYSSHPLLSAITMIAPSPDWLSGISALNLQEDGLWKSEVILEAHPYDAGTDSGVSFRSPDQATDPHIPIHMLNGFPFEDSPPLGTFTVRLVSVPGDVNKSGALDTDDLNEVCRAFGSTDERFDFTGDGLVGQADITKIVERLMGTRTGDTDLDGQVAFNDFLALSNNFGLDGGYHQGDFDCDGMTGFPDFLILSQNFGFDSQSEGALASVPEPSGISWVVLMSLLGLHVTRRNGSRR